MGESRVLSDRDKAVDRMHLPEHWLADKWPTEPVRVVRSERMAERYRQDGWSVVGPFVHHQRGVVDVPERHAYVCPICHATWPHPSYKCSGIGGFADHPETATVLENLIPAPTRGVVSDSRAADEEHVHDWRAFYKRGAPGQPPDSMICNDCRVERPYDSDELERLQREVVRLQQRITELEAGE